MLDGVSILSERVIKPSRWRKQHGEVKRAVEMLSFDAKRDGKAPQIVDSHGEVGDPYRGLSLLDTWEKSKKISREMRLAGEHFHEEFHLACLGPIAAADMARIGGSPGPMKHRGSIDARDAIRGALAALGGPESPSGCAAWFCLGSEFSLRDWAIREGWRGRSIDQKVAAGILIGTLGVLARHFGYEGAGMKRT